MCGIFGFVIKKNNYNNSFIKSSVTDLLKLAQTRGKDASGIAITNKHETDVLKRNIKADELIKTKEFNNLLSKHFKSDFDNFGVIGHSRMVTNGSHTNHFNNQPVIKSSYVIVHNGIIVNDNDLWNNNDLLREFEVDTEVLLAIYEQKIKSGKDYFSSLSELYSEIKGSASIAILNKESNTISLASNNGSLYVAENKDIIAFASERNMLEQSFIKNKGIIFTNILQINKQNFALINIDDCKIHYFNPENIEKINIDFSKTSKKANDIYTEKNNAFENIIINNSDNNLVLEKKLEDNQDKINALKRCTKCLLPETFPNISFDKEGVCSICNSWSPINYKGAEELEHLIEKNRKFNKQPDILVPLSGGRDSCYALHYLKKELNLNPVAYTYDWGMVTDIARRNISRITAELGVEHILISADIKKKREYIKMNVNAWLKRPSLGTVPLFMAGDKQFFYYANQLKKQFDLELLVFGMNPLERTDFKVAFTGVKEKTKEDRHYHLSLMNKLGIAAYYGKEYLLNPSYFNKSLFDTFEGFLSYYFIPHNYHVFFEYIPWNEQMVNDTIINLYDWEVSNDTPTTWRIGDGTATFYNYIYLTVAGFTENDTFRSNQIRQGLISREEAMKCVINENKPRYESIKWYCDTINIDFEETIKRINKIKKLY